MGLLPYDIYYENSRGERLCLSTPPFVMTRSDLFDRKWQLTTAARPLSEGARLIGRRRPCDEKSMTVEVIADTPEELSARLCELCDIFDKDIHAATAGRLYVNGQYLACWCTACVKDLSCDFTSRASVRLSVYPEHPAWCTERRYTFSADLSETDEDEDDGHNYPYSYPYRYGSGRRSLSICNEHFAPAPMRIYFFGPAENPDIYVAGNRIGINITLLAGEYAVVDQLTHEVYKISATGQRQNCFDARIKNGLTFQYAPSGSSLVELGGDSGVDIILIEQRSEPRWTMS